MVTTLTGKNTEVKFGQGLPTVIIAERINPTGRKSLAEELKLGKLDIVRNDAIKQAEAGAHIIDVNVGAVSVDEVEMLPRAIRTVMEVTDRPICIDSANPKAIKAALEVYPYKALINSVNGKEESMEEILPMVKESGSAVVCLTMDSDGIKNDVESRVKVARKIIARADSLGIKREDLVVDCLVMTASTDTNSGRITLDTMRQVVAEFGVSTTMGASNISFGMPNRDLLNIHFLTMAIINGLTAPITDPLIEGIIPAMRAADFLAGRDPYGMIYISDYRKK
ncbi:MAG: 5-methyltetrahydrofolate:corrinoid/iron-sulfur protein co-methyltransferase [Actinobacteria bacterium ADurb.Bin346]|nr:MAG: 5-methyltetrahydrofolate:corrinoid/iron-sulfur protein co-methyltransferase [Actinobacteria bacterium ADurb.Bin346]